MLNGGDKLSGFVGQSMGASKTAGAPRLVSAMDTLAGAAMSGSFTAPVACWVAIFAWGSGGSGYNDGSNGHAGTTGGGGAGAGRRSVLLQAGKTLSWVASTAAGGATVVTLPDGAILTASGGASPGAYNAAAPGGVPTGLWDEVNAGGAGAYGSGDGATGQNGAAGGAHNASTNSGGGGGAAGFTDLGAPTNLVGGAGSAGSGTSKIGGNGGGGNPSNYAQGRVVLIAMTA